MRQSSKMTLLSISWEEQRKGLGLKGRTAYKVKKKNGDIVTYILDIDKEIV